MLGKRTPATFCLAEAETVKSANTQNNSERSSMTKIATAAALATAVLAVSSPAALAQGASPSSGHATVNDFTSADQAKAFREARSAGFTPDEVTMAQAGTLFVKAMKGGGTYLLTVTPDGKVYANRQACHRRKGPLKLQFGADISVACKTDGQQARFRDLAEIGSLRKHWRPRAVQ
jgi:hypothetical protein